jgi:DNA-binding MarR family transcriptional regulator
MLLALFIAGEQGEKIGVSKVWAAGGVGSGTGVRVLERLEEQGLVERDRHPGRRIQYLSLTGSARQQMIEYLESIG